MFDDDDVVVEVKQYLPVNKKLELVGEVVNLCVDEELKFYNPGKIEIYFTLFVFVRSINTIVEPTGSVFVNTRRLPL